MVAALGVEADGNSTLTWGRPVRCMLRLTDDGNRVVELGHISGSAWFDVGPEAVTVPRKSPVDSARSFLNKKRAMIGMPDVTGYSDYDILADARHYGWRDES